jgi:catechol 2,3-dioxygenase-like lactoylglutathione lyase family enzyme
LGFRVPSPRGKLTLELREAVAELSQEDDMLKWPVWIGVVCEDLEAQRRFYRDTLGLNEVRAGEGFVWFEFEDKLFELLAKSAKPQYDRRRVSFAFEVDDIQATRAELVARGVEPVTDIEGGPESRQYWAYFKDREENLFEVVQRLG